VHRGPRRPARLPPGNLVHSAPTPGRIAACPATRDGVRADDLGFADGSIHIAGTTVDAAFFVDPHGCLGRATLQQTGEVAGGTGRLAGGAQAALHKVDR